MVKKTEIVDDEAGDLTDSERRAAEELADLDAASGGELFRVTDEIRAVSGARLQIVRSFPSTPGSRGHVGDMDPSEFSVETMRQRFGYGIYQVRVIGPRGFLPGGGRVEIANNPQAEKSAPNDVMALLETIERRQAERDKDREARRDRMLELLIPAMAPVVAAMIGNRGPDLAGLIAALKPAPGPSMTDLITAVSSLKNLSGAQDSGSNVDKVFDIMERVKGLTGEGGEKQSNWLDIVRDLLKEAGPAAKTFLEQRAQPVAPIEIQPLARPAIAPPAAPAIEAPVSVQSPAPVIPVQAPQSGDDMLAMFMPMIKSNLSKVAGWAQADKNPQTYAEVFFDELPQAVAQYISPADALKYLKHEKWFEIVCQIEPKFKVHREWCNDFRLELIDIVQEGANDDVTSSDQITDGEHTDNGE